MSEWAMKVSILASGSSGNVTYVETKTQKFLIDAGLSCKKIEQLLNQINRQASDLDGIFVTHEHVDHIKGIGVLARKYQMPIYANEKTWQEIERVDSKISNEQKFIFPENKVITIGDVDIESYDVSHDAISPQFYSFHCHNERIVLLTDTGYVSDKLRQQLKNATVYLMESNHDVELLRAGKYPWSTKQRILSDKGHLSNEDSALALSEMIGSKTKRIYLGHLSRENNIKTLAKQTCESILKEMGHGVNDTVTIYNTDPQVPTKLITI